MKVTVLNTIEELKSFPLNQVIKIKFERPVEDSQLKSCISLIRNVNQTGLFNISETYNQSLGYIREKFDVEDITLTTETNTDSFIVSVKPVKPLSPGFEYTLFIDKSLSSEYISIDKPTSKSKSTIQVDVSNNNNPLDLTLEIISEPLITSTSNLIKILLKDGVKGTSKQITLDLKNKNYTNYDNITITFSSVVYVLGEVFTVLSIGYQPLTENLFTVLRASLTENIKPIDNDSEYKSVSNEDLLNFFNKEEIEYKNKKELVHNNKILITLDNNITTDELDFNNITFQTSEAFGMYTLSSLELYDETKQYEVIPTVVDKSSFYLTVKEIV